MQSNNIAFSHRPADGISIGVTILDDVAYLAACFTRVSMDQFGRKRARQIITQRITSQRESNEPIRLVKMIKLPSYNMDTRSIIRELRKLFKPDPTCNDHTFSQEYNFPSLTSIPDILLYEPVTRNEAWNKIVDMFTTAVAAASIQQTA